MTDDMINLGKRAVACKGWRWMPGMRTADAMRVIHDPDRWPDRPCAIREGGWVDTAPPRPLKDDLPDLSDPATVGCLLALVQEAWGPDLRIFRDGVWFVEFAPSKVPEDMYAHRTFTAHTLVDALVAALEGAP